jgi:RNA polymerase sigma factor (sigma-70 family)
MTTAARSSKVRPQTLSLATLTRFRAGDGEAFAVIVRAYLPLVRAAVARYWSNEFEREEAMQEIWMHVFEQRQSFDPARADSLSGWLAVLARRRCVDLLRQRANAPIVGDVDEDHALDWLHAAPPAPDLAEDRELQQAVSAFVERLKPGWRDFFHLYFVEGLDYDEIARRLKVSKLRCKYMRKVLAARASRNPGLLAALSRGPGGARAP